MFLIKFSEILSFEGDIQISVYLCLCQYSVSSYDMATSSLLLKSSWIIETFATNNA